jgi:hypothetical protein
MYNFVPNYNKLTFLMLKIFHSGKCCATYVKIRVRKPTDKNDPFFSFL